MNISEYLILLASALIGGTLAYVWKEYKREWIGIILAFAGSFILGIIATHLLPGIFGSETSSRSGLFLLAGFMLQLFFSNISHGAEHGHFHKEHADMRQFYIIFFGLCIHALVEGLPLSGYTEFDLHGHHGHEHRPGFNHLMAGVAFHKLPEAYVLALIMRLNQVKGWKFWTVLFGFAAMTPLGALLGKVFIPDVEVLRWTMAFVVGSLLHISTTILFESEQKGHHHISWQKVTAIVIGILLALLAT